MTLHLDTRSGAAGFALGSAPRLRAKAVVGTGVMSVEANRKSLAVRWRLC